MQIVIDIPDEDYEKLKWTSVKNGSFEDSNYMRDLILNGTPFPKGHGRLIDADALKEDTNYSNYDGYYHAYSTNAIHNAPTILEAEVKTDEDDA